jgi:gamma-glutamyl-gamma-aminobutyrate hydrolase PuuD
MMAPIIGVTTLVDQVKWGVWDRKVALLTMTYIDAISRAGGVPVLLPPNDFGASEVVERLDGLILSGGADIDPARFGQEAHPRTVIVADRDAWEFAVLSAALERDLPVLAICRGIQVLNVAVGGSLHQHLPEVLGHQDHLHTPGTFGSTKVRLEKGCRLERLLGDRVTVPCHHHQGIDQLGAGLVAVGWADDGMVEAAELVDRRFVVGVQWHPEQDQGDLRLFEALVEEARSR